LETRHQQRLITVPAGYRTDFASIPRLVWPLLPPVGRGGKAAIIHDWLCDEHTRTASTTQWPRTSSTKPWPSAADRQIKARSTLTIPASGANF